MSDDYEPKLVHLPGTRLTPEVVLHRTLNKIDRIKSVVVVIQWDDGSHEIDWSQQTTSVMCTASTMLQYQAQRLVMGDAPSDAYVTMEPDKLI